MTTYRDVHNDNYYLPDEEPESTEDRLDREERKFEQRRDEEDYEDED